MDDATYRRQQHRASVAEAALRTSEQRLLQAEADRRLLGQQLHALRQQITDTEAAVIEADHLWVQLQQARDDLAGAEEHAMVLTEQLDEAEDYLGYAQASVEGNRWISDRLDHVRAFARAWIAQQGGRLWQRALAAEARAVAAEARLAKLADRARLIDRLQRERDARRVAERQVDALRRELASRPPAPRPVFVLGPQGAPREQAQGTRAGGGQP